MWFGYLIPVFKIYGNYYLMGIPLVEKTPFYFKKVAVYGKFDIFLHFTMRLLAQNPILSGFEGRNSGLNERRYHPFQVVKMASNKPSSLLHPKKGLVEVTRRQIPDKYLAIQ